MKEEKVPLTTETPLLTVLSNYSPREADSVSPVNFSCSPWRSPVDWFYSAPAYSNGRRPYLVLGLWILLDIDLWLNIAFIFCRSLCGWYVLHTTYSSLGDWGPVWARPSGSFLTYCPHCFFPISFSKRHFHGHTKITDKILSFFQCCKFLFHLSSTLFLYMARDAAQFHRVLRQGS